MPRRSLFVLIALMGFAPAAHAAPTPQQLCESAMELASAKYAQCRLNAESKDTKKPDAMKLSDALGKCSQKLSDAFAKATDKYGAACAATENSTAFDDYLKQCSDDATAAAAGASLPDYVGDLASCNADLSTCTGDLAACEACGNGTVDAGEACDGSDLNGATCTTQGSAGGTLRCASGCTLDTSGCWATRFVDNGNGTVTDNQTKLVWEKKTTAVGSGENLADPHDVDNIYSWGFIAAANGTAFTDFIARLNGSANGLCFANQCDWRLPTSLELYSIRDLAAPGCGAGSPCISGVFGPTVLDYYWSSSTSVFPADGGYRAWATRFVDVLYGLIDYKPFSHHVRAVRGDSGLN